MAETAVGDTPAYVGKARALIDAGRVTDAAAELLAGLKDDADCPAARAMLDDIFQGKVTEKLLAKRAADASGAAAETTPALPPGMVALEMTPEAEAEHEWWVYWFSFVGTSLLGVLSLFAIFISVAVAESLSPHLPLPV